MTPEELLPPGELDTVGSMAMDALRSRRSACQEAETRLSYLRRLAQGRLDIVHAELDRRAIGGGADLGAAVEGLTDALATHITASGSGRFPQALAPDVADPGLTAELDEIAPPGRLTALDRLDDEEVRGLASALVDFERDVSARRHALHERIDAFQREIVRRYKDGEASVDSLLT